MSKKPRGEVWDHFLLEEAAETLLKTTVICKYCGWKAKGNTTRMSDHLSRCPKGLCLQPASVRTLILTYLFLHRPPHRNPLHARMSRLQNLPFPKRQNHHWDFLDTLTGRSRQVNRRMLCENLQSPVSRHLLRTMLRKAKNTVIFLHPSGKISPLRHDMPCNKRSWTVS